MENLNLVELLKDCPTGMELDCTMYDNCTLEIVFEGCLYPIQIQTPEGLMNLTKYGSMSQNHHSKCVIFPKGKTTWEGFVPLYQFEDGDVVVAEDDESIQLFLLKHFIRRRNANDHNGDCYFGWDFQCNKLFEEGIWSFERLATEEEKQKLFQAIKDNGYKWNAETKTLEQLPKFKVGDKVKRKDVNYTFIITITKLDGDYYDYINEDGQCGVIYISAQDDWELVPNKFDITTLKPFESRVLVRDYDNQIWIPTFWGKYLEDDSNCRYLTFNGCYRYCIPYERNEHLLGTSDDCDPFFKTWKK